MQVVDFRIYVTVDVAVTESIVISTAQDFSGGTLYANATMALEGGGGFNTAGVYDFSQNVQEVGYFYFTATMTAPPTTPLSPTPAAAATAG